MKTTQLPNRYITSIILGIAVLAAAPTTGE
jgi:hypothetical protein